jgi:hypothetical protein
MILAVSLDQTSMSVGVVLGLLGVAGIIIGHFKVFLPWWGGLKGQVVSGRDTLVGRPPIVDPVSKKVIAPALPSLGERLEVHQTEINGSLRDIVALLESQQAQDRRLNDHEDRLGEHGGRIRTLEEAAVERIVTKAESASAWRAVEAVANGHDAPDESAELD